MAAAGRRSGRPRWWSPRCGRWCSGWAPTSRTSSRWWCDPGSSSIATSWCRSWCSPATAARTWSSTGARWRCGVPSSTCSRPPPTVRCASTSGATRSTGSPSSRWRTSARSPTCRPSRSFPAASCCPPPEVRERAERLIGLEPWGREQWERLAQGLVFDGMESWLPWLTKGEHVLLDIVGDGAQVLLCEPRRMRDRAADLLAEEADLAATLAVTWGAVGNGDRGRARRRRRRGPAPGGAAGRAGTRPRLPPPAPRLRPPAGPHQGAGLARGERPRQPRHAPGVGLGLGPGGGRRLRPDPAAGGAAARRVPGRGRRRRRRVGRAAAGAVGVGGRVRPRWWWHRWSGGRCCGPRR